LRAYPSGAESVQIKGDHRFMSDICVSALINEALSSIGDESVPGHGIGAGTIRAAEQVLAAAKAAGSVNAELVLHAVIELLEAARRRQSA
jgi:hypothetical protein